MSPRFLSEFIGRMKTSAVTFRAVGIWREFGSGFFIYSMASDTLLLHLGFNMRFSPFLRAIAGLILETPAHPRLWHWLLRPDNVPSKYPAAGLESKCEPPRDADHIAVFECGLFSAFVFWLTLPSSSGIVITTCSARSGIRVRDIKPENAIVSEDALDLIAYRHEMANKHFRSRFAAERPRPISAINAMLRASLRHIKYPRPFNILLPVVLAERVVWRRGYDRMEISCGER
jgi:hypothetical protein